MSYTTIEDDFPEVVCAHVLFPNGYVLTSLSLFSTEEGSAEYVSFDELIETADVISLHCPLSKETRHMLSDPEFSRMKDGVFIVNTARGAGK